MSRCGPRFAINAIDRRVAGLAADAAAKAPGRSGARGDGDESGASMAHRTCAAVGGEAPEPGAADARDAAASGAGMLRAGEAAKGGPASGPPGTAGDPAAGMTSSEAEELIYVITHDVRASLRAIMTLPNWIMEDLRRDNALLSKDVVDNFARLHVQSRRLDNILLDLRKYSRIGRVNSERVAVPLDEALEEALMNIGTDRVELHADLGGVTIQAARGDVVLLFSELLDNVVQHAEARLPVVRVEASANDAGVAIAFEDSGCGVAPEFRERVFGMMKRLVSRDEREGTGAGLTICRKVVSALGGRIEMVDPQTLGGARVEISLPLQRQ